MKNEVRFWPSVTALNLSAKKSRRQVSPAKSRQPTWRIPPTAEYLKALREAEQAVYRFMLERN